MADTFFIFLLSLSIYLPLPSIILLSYFCMVLLDVSSNNFLQKYNFSYFDLILFKPLFCEISFSDFVYLLLDRFTFLGIFKQFSFIFFTFL